MKQLVLASILVGTVAGPPLPASAPALAASCQAGTLTNSGTATSEDRAKRNAEVSLMQKLGSLYPGDLTSRLLGPVGYECRNPLLWLCEATVKYCK
jgi:hypothetical protein